MYWTVNVDGGPSGPFYKTVAVRDKIYSFGGYDDDSLIDVQVLQTENYQWSVLKAPDSASPQYNEIPHRRIGHTVVVYKDLVYIWGGHYKVTNYNDLFCFDTNTNLWSKPMVKGVIPPARSGHSACVINGAMLIFGGRETNSGELFQDLHKLDLKTMKWSHVHAGGEPPNHREKHSATVINNCMYIFGGFGSTGPNDTDATFWNDVVYLDTTTMQWITPELKGPYRPDGRVGHLSFCYEDALFVFGGWNGRSIYNDLFNDLLQYNPDSCSWSIVKPNGNGPLPRFGQQCCLIGDRAFLIGGMRTIQEVDEDEDENDDFVDDDFQELFDDLHVLDFAPSLKTLSIKAVLDNKLDQDFLPETIQSDIKAMILPSSNVFQFLNNTG